MLRPVSVPEGRAEHCSAPTKTFVLERLADDVVYQSIARPRVIAYLRDQRCNPLDFSAASEAVKTQCVAIAHGCWEQWADGPGRAILTAAGISPDQARAVRFSFPWQRAFECEVEADQVASR